MRWHENFSNVNRIVGRLSFAGKTVDADGKALVNYGSGGCGCSSANDMCGGVL